MKRYIRFPYLKEDGEKTMGENAKEDVVEMDLLKGKVRKEHGGN